MGRLRQAILGRIDGGYSNLSTSRYYLNNVIGEPGALVFDSTQPHIGASRVLSSVKHPGLIEEFNRFLVVSAEEIAGLKERHSGESGIATH